MKKIFLGLFAILLSVSLSAQYSFTTTNSIDCSNVKSQGKTGTCWSFSTTSFLESELLRKGVNVDLSEMFLVRTTYMDKAHNYLMRQTKAQFSQGGLSHDVMNAFKQGGIVPESIYSGKIDGQTKHDHSKMADTLKVVLTRLGKAQYLTPEWVPTVNAIMDDFMGKQPTTFTYDGQTYTPQSYAESLDINPDDYYTFTSFTHHDFYDKFILEIPDNYSNGTYHNVPLNELQEIADYAVKKGYTVAWDGDVSEPGFSGKNGLAVLPMDKKREDLFQRPGAEQVVTQENRQIAFDSYGTTDDHLMHLVGTAEDQNGKKYYIIKNSWGEISDYKGYLYMSEAYYKMKTVAILVHKNAIPKSIRKKFKIK